MIQIHDLKTWPEYFGALADMTKTFELRKNDRNFQVGDVINCREWEPGKKEYTGQVLRYKISYILPLYRFIPCDESKEFVILGIQELNPAKKYMYAIQRGHLIECEYQENPRTIIPLAWGKMKNGKNALLCFKINGYDEDGPDLSIRLYHAHKIKFAEIAGEAPPFSKKIDYYLTKHFRKIYIQVHED